MPTTIDVPTPVLALLPFNKGAAGDNYVAVATGMAVVMAAPEPDAVLPTTTATFSVGVDNYDDGAYTAEVQYASNNTFTTGAVLLTAPVDLGDGGVDMKNVTPLPSTGFWRARLWLGTRIALDWTAPQGFSVAQTFAAIKMPITWTVNASAARPIHVWHLDPPSNDVGSPVKIYGQGFPTTGTVTCMGVTVAQSGWTRVADTGLSTGRQINGSTVDPEHYEVTVTVPDVEEPGGPLVVGT